jgi:hypothetical protein
MRVYLCPKCHYATAHPEDVGPLDEVTPGKMLSDGEKACSNCGNAPSRAKAAAKKSGAKAKASTPLEAVLEAEVPITAPEP